jgi:hypothetical protein
MALFASVSVALGLSSIGGGQLRRRLRRAKK